MPVSLVESLCSALNTFFVRQRVDMDLGTYVDDESLHIDESCETRVLTFGVRMLPRSES